MENLNVGVSTVAIESIVKEKIRLETELEKLREVVQNLDYFSTCSRCLANLEMVETTMSKINGGEL
jgi:hypothetical protein